ncbi:MAG: hypothetical protein HKN28_12320 [Alphaproteobacteria bacterium]|nr:hypothetical protein [Alphaproteobacteria bacterium]
MMNDDGASSPVIVEIEHGFFKAFGDGYFRLSSPPDEKPIFCSNLGEQEVSLPLDGIIRELALKEDSSLWVMLQTIGKSLKYVTVLKLGDEVPAEIRNGKASWKAEAKHLRTAQQKLKMQLITWVSGRELRTSDPAELHRFFEDPATIERTTEAFNKAAEHLGLEDSDEVVTMIENFAVELSYIEELSERFKQIEDLQLKLGSLRKRYVQQNKIIDELDSVLRLIKKPVACFRSSLEKVETQTDAILATLRQLDVRCSNVRDVRDDLHVRIEAWSDIIDWWKDLDPENSPEIDEAKAIRDLYRFLAQRYLDADEWVLMFKENGETGNRYGGVMTW